LQESREDRILDDCPKPDSDIPPLPLLYSGFGEFHDFITNLAQNPDYREAPGGWFSVAMKYYPSADRIFKSKNLCDHEEIWLKDINNVVKRFRPHGRSLAHGVHAQGYVHGDLRPPNFTVNGGRLFPIDFDWGGKEGEATFPRKRLHSILQDSRRDMRITKEHDERERVKEYTKRLISEAIKQARVRCEVPGLPSSS
jgi:hypothetical protein